ncbi:MAG: cation diffusion facilitator family transporter [Acholeplasmataceae bacterium]
MNKRKKHSSDLSIIYQTSTTTLVGNLLLASIKLIAGIFGFSRALISDAIHSLSDVFSTLIVMIGLTIAKKDADKNHPYGHEKFESVASIILSMILIFTAGILGYYGILSLIQFFNGTLLITRPTYIALGVAIISIISKEGMYWYTRYYAQKLKSTAMFADAWHHRSDALSSIGSVIGIGFAMLGYVYFDAIASIVISLIVLKVAIKIMIKAVNQIVDKAPDKTISAKIETLIMNQKGVLGIDLLHIRMHVEKLYVDVEICVDRSLSLVDAHVIAENVHDIIESTFEEVKHCMVHVNPKIH